MAFFPSNLLFRTFMTYISELKLGTLASVQDKNNTTARQNKPESMFLLIATILTMSHTKTGLLPYCRMNKKQNV